MHLAAVEHISRAELSSAHMPERQMWCAVLNRALQDALDDPTESYQHHVRDQLRHAAREWFIRSDADFEAACNGAGYDPAVVRERFLRLLANHPCYPTQQ